MCFVDIGNNREVMDIFFFKQGNGKEEWNDEFYRALFFESG